jgi:hypothetical protein
MHIEDNQDWIEPCTFLGYLWRVLMFLGLLLLLLYAGLYLPV